MMKTVTIVTLGILAILIFVQAHVVKTTEETEQQGYKIIKKYDGFEIRYYPEAILASVRVSGEYGSSSGKGFSILAGYIFGGNDENQSIPMTAPVHMEQLDDGYRMSFVMPKSFDMNSLPVPENSQIEIKKSVPVYTATVRFGGYADQDKINQYKAQLAQQLKDNGIVFSEPFIFLGYNPPYQAVDRRNEVMVQIKYPN